MLPLTLKRSFLLLSALVAVSPIIRPASAQTAPPTVMILPVDGAQFLPGTRFDLRVEVHTLKLPSDFAVTVNGKPASTFFATKPVTETWTFGDDDTPSQSVIWRQLTAPTAGEYVVAVTAGGATTKAMWTVRKPQPGEGAKNIILFMADGASVPLFTAARLVSHGQTNGVSNAPLAFETFEEFGLSKTSSLLSIITDSAAGASAWMTGHKAAVSATGSYPDTSPDTLDDPRVETFAELIKRKRNMSVGIVSDADVTNATTASLYGHGRERDSKERSAFIAEQVDKGPIVDVFLGGGKRFFVPKSEEGSRREDERELLADYDKAGYQLVQTTDELAALVKQSTAVVTSTNSVTGTQKVLGLFTSGSLDSWLDRKVFGMDDDEHAQQPDLPTMTVAGLELLKGNPNGFFMMVENDFTDSALHILDADRAVSSAIEFERAVAAAVEWTKKNAPDTLILVTADHGFGFDVYGTVDIAAFNDAKDDAAKLAAIGVEDAALPPTYVDKDGNGFPDTWVVSRTLAYSMGNSPSHTEDFQVSTGEREPVVAVDEEGTAFKDNPDDDPTGIPISATVPLGVEDSVHTLTDVPIYATGPGARFFGRVIENREFFFGMAQAIGLDPAAKDGIATGTNK